MFLTVACQTLTRVKVWLAGCHIRSTMAAAFEIYSDMTELAPSASLHHCHRPLPLAQRHFPWWKDTSCLKRPRLILHGVSLIGHSTVVRGRDTRGRGRLQEREIHVRAILHTRTHTHTFPRLKTMIEVPTREKATAVLQSEVTLIDANSLFLC